jgi:hypothetical protein
MMRAARGADAADTAPTDLVGFDFVLDFTP